MQKIFVVIIMMICAALFITCGKENKTVQKNESAPPEPAAVSQSYERCTLITIAEIQSYFPGAEIKISRADTQPNAVGQKICYWSAGDAEMKFVQLSVGSNADIKSGRIKVEELYENEKKMAEGIKEVTGIGDTAYYGGSGLKVGAGLHVLINKKSVKLDLMVGLGTGNSDEQQHLDIEIALAKKVIERL